MPGHCVSGEPYGPRVECGLIADSIGKSTGGGTTIGNSSKSVAGIPGSGTTLFMSGNAEALVEVDSPSATKSHSDVFELSAGPMESGPVEYCSVAGVDGSSVCGWGAAAAEAVAAGDSAVVELCSAASIAPSVVVPPAPSSGACLNSGKTATVELSRE